MNVASREASLDGLRGLAALSVVFQHCLEVFPGYRNAPLNIVSPDFWTNPFAIAKHTPLGLASAGTIAVLIFFVLSGYVLTLAITRVEHRFTGYAVKRMARLYLPFLFSILFAALLFAMAAQPMPVAGTSPWFNAYPWTNAPALDLVLGHLLLLDVEPYNSLNVVMWSLVHEIRISLIFPLLVLWTRRNPVQALAATCIASAAAHALTYVTPDLVDSWLRTMRYVPLFVGGSALALHRQRVGEWVAGLSPAARASAWAAVLLLLLTPFWNDLTLYYVGPAAVMAVALCRCDPAARRILTTAAPQYLGRISYSLYLVHLPIMLAAVHLLHRELPLAVIVLSAALVSVGVAEAVFRVVEVPAKDWGQRLARQRSRIAAAHS